MKKTKAPFKYHGSYIGKFDAYVCIRCRRTYFTEKAYNDIMQLPLNPEEQDNYSEVNYMPTEIIISSYPVDDKNNYEMISLNNKPQISITTSSECSLLFILAVKTSSSPYI